MKSRHSLLKILFFLQIMLAAVGFLVFSVSFRVFDAYRAKEQARQKAEEVGFALKGKIDLWTSWVILDMQEAIGADMGGG